MMIAQAILADASELNQLVNSSYRGDSSRQGWTTEADLLDGTRIDEAAIRDLIQKPGTVLLTYRETSELLGCVELRSQDDKLYLGMLSVKPDTQGKGIGKKLMRAAEDYAQQQNITTIFMTVISVRKELIDWYIRHGYQLTGERKPFIVPDTRWGVPKKELEFVVLEKKIKLMLKVIAFDADDTLWHNEAFFQETEKKLFELLENYLPQHTTARELLKTEIDNLPLYGYGIKAFILSMIETAMRVTDNTLPNSAIEKIISYGKEMLNMPVEVMDGVEEVLSELKGKYRLVMATKGDLLDQERKLKKSGLEKYFHHIEIMSEKKEDDFRKLIKHLDIAPHEFAMIGNSLKSDVIPVLALGGHGFHIPYHITWAHERVDTQIASENFKQLTSIREILNHV